MEQPKNNFKLVADKKNARMLLPNILTLIGVCIGLTSIRFALSGEFHLAIIAIIFAALIDGHLLKQQILLQLLLNETLHLMQI